MEWVLEPVGRRHNRRAFDCGEPELNNYLARYARQNHESGLAKTFVAMLPGEPTRVLGYYTISPASVRSEEVPREFIERGGQYPLPVYRLARLAIDLSVQGEGLGTDLLFDAGERALEAAAQVGGVALLIDAQNERAAAWYARFGAGPIRDSPLTLLLPLRTFEAARRPRTRMPP